MSDDLATRLLGVVRGTIPLVAARMNVSIADAQVSIIAEDVFYALDEAVSVRMLQGTPKDDSETLIELAAKHLRSFYFLQVGLRLGLLLGYSYERDLAYIQHLSEVFDTAFEQTRSDKQSEFCILPAVDEYVAAILARGFQFPHLSVNDDGNTVTEWRRVWMSDDGTSSRCLYEAHRPACDGPAIIVTHPNGTDLYEEYMEHGKTHRIGGPAICTRDEGGAILTVSYLRNGEFHREDGPAVIKFIPHTDAICWAAFYIHGKSHREDGPAVIALGGECDAIHLGYYRHGIDHRNGGLPSTITVQRESLETSLHYFEHGLPRTGAPTCVSYDVVGIPTAEVWYRADSKAGYHSHREDGPSYWRIGFGRLQIEYRLNGDLHRTSGPAQMLFDLDGHVTYAGWYRNGKSLRDGSSSTIDQLLTGVHGASLIPDHDLAFAREVLTRWRMGASITGRAAAHRANSFQETKHWIAESDGRNS